MPRKALDLTNQEFGRLVAIKTVGKARSGNYIWHCKCECGNTKDVLAGNLVCGAIRSCGCLTKENYRIWSEKRREEGLTGGSYKHWKAHRIHGNSDKVEVVEV